jgi:CheY-like chemotaxis protein
VKLLIVDDSKAMRAIVRRALNSFEHETFSIKKASSGKEALVIIGDWHPDIILSDWHMPGMSGLELISIIKRKNLPIKVGLVTTEKNPERLQQAIEAGAEFVLAKPFNHQALHEIILPLINKKSDIDTNNEFVLPDLARLQLAFKRSLSVEINLVSVPRQQVTSETLPCVIGLFEDSESKKTRAIAILNMKVACVMGGLKSTFKKNEIITMINQGEINREALAGCKKVLSDSAIAFNIPQSKRSLNFKSLIIVDDELEKVESLLNKVTEQRLDFSCEIANLKSGVITIVAN